VGAVAPGASPKPPTITLLFASVTTAPVVDWPSNVLADKPPVAESFTTKPSLPTAERAPDVTGKCSELVFPAMYRLLPLESKAVPVAVLPASPPTSTENATWPLAEYFVTNTAFEPNTPMRGSVTGKSGELVFPVT